MTERCEVKEVGVGAEVVGEVAVEVKVVSMLTGRITLPQTGESTQTPRLENVQVIS